MTGGLFGQQLPIGGDAGGEPRDVAAAHERLKLFEPAPRQIPGQEVIELGDNDESPPRAG